MQKRITAGLIGALGLFGGIAVADERGVEIKNVDAADAYVTVVDKNDGNRVILDHYRMNHGETYSVTPTFGADHSYYLQWHAERAGDRKAKDGECYGQNTPCGFDLWKAK